MLVGNGPAQSLVEASALGRIHARRVRSCQAVASCPEVETQAASLADLGIPVEDGCRNLVVVPFLGEGS